MRVELRASSVVDADRVEKDVAAHQLLLERGRRHVARGIGAIGHEQQRRARMLARFEQRQRRIDRVVERGAARRPDVVELRRACPTRSVVHWPNIRVS